MRNTTAIKQQQVNLHDKPASTINFETIREAIKNAAKKDGNAANVTKAEIATELKASDDEILVKAAEETFGNTPSEELIRQLSTQNELNVLKTLQAQQQAEEVTVPIVPDARLNKLIRNK